MMDIVKSRFVSLCKPVCKIVTLQLRDELGIDSPQVSNSGSRTDFIGSQHEKVRKKPF